MSERRTISPADKITWLGNSHRLPLQRSTRSISGPSSPGSASIRRKVRLLFTSTDGPAILQTRSFRQSKLT